MQDQMKDYVQMVVALKLLMQAVLLVGLLSFLLKGNRLRLVVDPSVLAKKSIVR